MNLDFFYIWQGQSFNMLNCPLNVQITEFIKFNLSLRKHADILEGTFLRPFITEYLLEEDVGI